jgi:hypothetical protein
VNIDLGEFVVFVDCPMDENNRPVLKLAQSREQKVFGY